MNRRIFLQLITYFSVWLGFIRIEHGLAQPANAQITTPVPLPEGSYGAGTYNQGTYNIIGNPPERPSTDSKTFLPVITTKE